MGKIVLSKNKQDAINSGYIHAYANHIDYKTIDAVMSKKQLRSNTAKLKGSIKDLGKMLKVMDENGKPLDVNSLRTTQIVNIYEQIASQVNNNMNEKGISEIMNGITQGINNVLSQAANTRDPHYLQNLSTKLENLFSILYQKGGNEVIEFLSKRAKGQTEGEILSSDAVYLAEVFARNFDDYRSSMKSGMTNKINSALKGPLGEVANMIGQSYGFEIDKNVKKAFTGDSSSGGNKAKPDFTFSNSGAFTVKMKTQGKDKNYTVTLEVNESAKYVDQGNKISKDIVIQNKSARSALQQFYNIYGKNKTTSYAFYNIMTFKDARTKGHHMRDKYNLMKTALIDKYLDEYLIGNKEFMANFLVVNNRVIPMVAIIQAYLNETRKAKDKNIEPELVTLRSTNFYALNRSAADASIQEHGLNRSEGMARSAMVRNAINSSNFSMSVYINKTRLIQLARKYGAQL